MKIIEVKDDYIRFDNGAEITFGHNQDCCEENYADFKQIEEQTIDTTFDEELNFGYDFKKLCEFRHKWDDGWVCSKCGVRKADWIEADIKTTTREESL